ncbi:MAG: hypothetical protein C5B47_03090, partial [Verrucomicrobia bacterium]
SGFFRYKSHWDELGLSRNGSANNTHSSARSIAPPNWKRAVRKERILALPSFAESYDEVFLTVAFV